MGDFSVMVVFAAFVSFAIALFFWSGFAIPAFFSVNFRLPLLALLLECPCL